MTAPTLHHHRRVWTIDSYLAVLDGEIGGRPTRRARLLTDVRGHLEDSVTELTEQGHDRATAEGIAVERFGEPVLVAHQLQTTPTLAYEEGVRSVCLGLCALYVMFLAGAVVPGALIAVLPLALAVVSYPIGLCLRLWERQRHMQGQSVPRAVTVLNGAFAGQTLRVVAAVALVSLIFLPLVFFWRWGWIVYAAGLLLAAAGWVALSWRASPTATTVKVRRRVAGAMLTVVAVPLALYAAVTVATLVVPSYDARGDVQLTACEADEGAGTITATVRITNHDEARHGYVIVPDVVQGGREVATLMQQVWRGPQVGKALRNAVVQPGQTVTVKYYSTVAQIPDHFTCRLDHPQTVKDATSLLH